MDKVVALSEILTQNPDDTFARYGLAIEYASRGEADQSIAQFDELMQRHPDYVPGYLMAAQTLAKSRRSTEARARLEQGIVTAQRTGDRHALSEMQAMLDDLEDALRPEQDDLDRG